MTNEQILKKAIKKAVKNGYKIKDWIHSQISEEMYYAIIFSHDFAKAFWGEKDTNTEMAKINYGSGDEQIIYVKEWELRLQQIVLEKEPLKYIEKFL